MRGGGVQLTVITVRLRDCETERVPGTVRGAALQLTKSPYGGFVAPPPPPPPPPASSPGEISPNCNNQED